MGAARKRKEQPAKKKADRWEIYDWIRRRFMNSGVPPTRKEVLRQFKGSDPKEIADGIHEFQQMISRAARAALKNTKHLPKTAQAQPDYIMCQKWNFGWFENELIQVKQLWEEGWHGEYIADKLKRKPQEVVCLVMDLYERGLIDERPGGWFGDEEKVLTLEDWNELRKLAKKKGMFTNHYIQHIVKEHLKSHVQGSQGDE